MRWLLKNDKTAEAAKLMLTAPRDADVLVDLDQWWLERRILVRKLLDDHDAQTAYRIARDAPPPERGNHRVDQHFTVGWIALRFLDHPVTAAAHFALISKGTVNPHALARAGYWQGRAADAMGHHAQAKAFYEQAATHSATYYGQLARGRLGLPDLGLRGPPKFTPAETAALSKLEVVRAVEILYAVRCALPRAIPFTLDLAERSQDGIALGAMAEVCARYRDARAMLLLGKEALAHGYAVRALRLPDHGHFRITVRSDRRSSRASSTPSRARKAHSTSRPFRRPRPMA